MFDLWEYDFVIVEDDDDNKLMMFGALPDERAPRWMRRIDVGEIADAIEEIESGGGFATWAVHPDTAPHMAYGMPVLEWAVASGRIESGDARIVVRGSAYERRVEIKDDAPPCILAECTRVVCARRKFRYEFVAFEVYERNGFELYGFMPGAKAPDWVRYIVEPGGGLRSAIADLEGGGGFEEWSLWPPVERRTGRGVRAASAWERTLDLEAGGKAGRIACSREGNAEAVLFPKAFGDAARAEWGKGVPTN